MNEKNLLGFLGLVRRAGRLETGMDRAIAAVIAGQTRLIITSSDISGNSLKKIMRSVEETGVKCMALPFTAEQFGEAVGAGNTAVAAVCDAGFAKALIKKLGEME